MISVGGSSLPYFSSSIFFPHPILAADAQTVITAMAKG
jgi:hypothetical protein